MGIVVVPAFGADPVTVTGPTLDSKVDGLATEFNGNIENANIKAGAAIAYAKLNLTGQIVNGDLKTIDTAGKVEGGALIKLDEIPTGAGAIPIEQLSEDLDTITAGILIDGSLAPIVAGAAAGCIPVPFTGTITNIKVFTDVATTAVLDVWKDTYDNYPPTVADTITASAKPTLTTATKYSDSTLTDWTTAVTAGDIIKINVDSNNLATWMVVAITFTRTA
jgi:hypothetical protein